MRTRVLDAKVRGRDATRRDSDGITTGGVAEESRLDLITPGRQRELVRTVGVRCGDVRRADGRHGRTGQRLAGRASDSAPQRSDRSRGLRGEHTRASRGETD